MADKPHAFPDVRRNDRPHKIGYVIRQMKDKQVALAMQPFDAQELLLMFVDPDVRETLTRAWDLVEPSGATQSLFVAVPTPAFALGDRQIGQPPATLLIRFDWHRHNCEKCFYVPYAAGGREGAPTTLRPDAPDELIERFNQVTDDLIDIHWRFSQVALVFNQLNDLCRTPAEMRYVWPCIYTLARRAKLTEADALAEASYREGGKVIVPPDLLPLLKTTNDTVASALLFDSSPKPPAPPIGYRLLESFPER